jgi:hypothetical protein
MRARDRILVCLYVAFAALPTFALALKLPDRKLDGSLAAAVRPKLTFDSFRADKFQPAFTSWFESSLGFRNWAIFIDNSILYRAFHETKLYARVVIGDDDVLFERDDIALINKGPPPAGKPDEVAERISTLQMRLRARGRAFVPIIVPSKTSVYRDAVPDKWRLQNGPEYASDRIYTETKRALDARGVTYVDGRALLTRSDIPRHLLWAPQARHWSDYGACLAMQQIFKAASQLSGPSIDVPCQYQVKRAKRSHDNYDLLRLLNVWKPRHGRANAIVTYDEPPPGPKPTIMFISTSFGWQILRNAQESQRFRELWLDYYDWILYGRPSGFEVENLPVDSAQWREVFLEQDIYVYELFETYLYADEKFVRILDNLLQHFPPP